MSDRFELEHFFEDEDEDEGEDDDEDQAGRSKIEEERTPWFSPFIKFGLLPEGNGHSFGSKNRAKFYRHALGSAKEAASAWNILEAKGFLEAETYTQGRELMLEVVRMLSAMTPL